jgi:hypothetical protein
MKELGVLIPRFYPLDSPSLPPILPLLMKKAYKSLIDDVSKVPFFY